MSNYHRVLHCRPGTHRLWPDFHLRHMHQGTAQILHVLPQSTMWGNGGMFAARRGYSLQERPHSRNSSFSLWNLCGLLCRVDRCGWSNHLQSIVRKTLINTQIKQAHCAFFYYFVKLCISIHFSSIALCFAYTGFGYVVRIN